MADYPLYGRLQLRRPRINGQFTATFTLQLIEELAQEDR